MDSQPSKEEIEAVFHRLRAISGNKVSLCITEARTSVNFGHDVS